MYGNSCADELLRAPIESAAVSLCPQKTPGLIDRWVDNHMKRRPDTSLRPKSELP